MAYHRYAACAAIGTAVLLAASCSNLLLDTNLPVETNAPVAVIVEAAILADLRSALDQYSDDLSREGRKTRIVSFPAGGDAAVLRRTIWEGAAEGEMAFLVGSLPSARYEMQAFGNREEFPIDLYLADRNCVWTDANGNGVFDAHGPLKASKAVSRLSGGAAELKVYFAKLHRYRSGGFPQADRAFIFKDDDWQNYERSSSFGLEKLVKTIETNESREDTLRQNYVSAIAQTPSLYVYQWIHAMPDTLFIQEGGKYSIITASEIGRVYPQGLFFNLFNCKAARYTEANLGTAYLTDTPYGLAAIGSTKIGGNYYPFEFHRSLARGRSWAQAFADWHREYGAKSDEWFLGMTSLGCPALMLKPAGGEVSTRGFSAGIPPPFVDEKAMLERMVEFDRSVR